MIWFCQAVYEYGVYEESQIVMIFQHAYVYVFEILIAHDHVTVIKNYHPRPARDAWGKFAHERRYQMFVTGVQPMSTFIARYTICTAVSIPSR